MAEHDAMSESFTRLGAVPIQQTLTRDEWVQRFCRFDLRGLVAVSPIQETYAIEAGWSLVRIGSFWRQDEEFHMYAMESAIESMVAMKRSSPSVLMNIVTPVFVFKRVGNRAVPDTGDAVLELARRNFMRFFDEVFKRRMTNG